MIDLPESLATSRLQLRLWQQTDVQKLVALMSVSVEHLVPWMPWAQDARLLDAGRVAAQIAEWDVERQVKQEYRYGLFVGGEPVGALGVHDRVSGGRELGYWLGSQHTGNGYMTEAAGAVTELLLSMPEIEFVQITVDQANKASIAVAQKLGFVNVEPVTRDGKELVCLQKS